MDLGKAGRMRPPRDGEDHVPLPEQEGQQQDNRTISSSRETAQHLPDSGASAKGPPQMMLAP